MDLEHRIEKSILIPDVCDIVYYHAAKHFNVFITYVINQAYQEKNYRRILWVLYFICLLHTQIVKLWSVVWVIFLLLLEKYEWS